MPCVSLSQSDVGIQFCGNANENRGVLPVNRGAIKTFPLSMALSCPVHPAIPFPISHFGRSMLSLVFPFPRLFFFPFLSPPSCPTVDPRGFFGERVSECFPPPPFFPFFAFLSFPFLPSHRLESPPASLIVFSSAVGNPSFYLLPSLIVSHRVNSPSFPSLLAPGRESTSLSASRYPRGPIPRRRRGGVPSNSHIVGELTLPPLPFPPLPIRAITFPIIR